MSITIATNNISSSTGTVTINGDIAANNLANVAFSGDYNDLINRPNGTGTNIVDSGTLDDGTFWRVYDDGYIEQGGPVPYGSNTNVTVTFPAEFTDSSSYVIFKNIGSTVTIYNPPDAAVSFFNYTATSAQTRQGANYKAHWYACGY